MFWNTGDEEHSDEKFRAAGLDGFGLYTAAGSWCLGDIRGKRGDLPAVWFVPDWFVRSWPSGIKAAKRLVDVVRRKWKAQRSDIAKLPIGEFGLADSQQEWLRVIDTKILGYEDALRARLSEIGAEIVPIPRSINVLDLVRRAINRRKPFPEGEGKKDGFRDTLIWRTLVESIAAENDDCEVWLISTNHNDFGDRKAAENDEACPYPLHPDLLDDLQTDNVAVRVSYVRTLGRLAQHLASTYGALPEKERDSLTADLDLDEFHRELRQLLNQLQLDPAASALPVKTLIGTVQSIGNALTSPSLVDVAMRGAGSWTAQFSQTISATVDIVSSARGMGPV